jgi:Uma2 family endonuclease
MDYTRTMTSPVPFEELLIRADEAGIRLEIVGGLPIWEAHPVYMHQVQVDRIRSSIKAVEDSDCACHHVADIYIKFPDGSFKRPDVALLCRTPDPSEFFTPITLVPEAVVEVISEGYEDKDLKLGPAFYLSHGVKDVLILDPRTLVVWHHRKDGVQRFTSPVNVKLECGCECTV